VLPGSLKSLRDYACTTYRGGTLLADQAPFRERLAQSYTDIQLMRLANLREISRYQRGALPGPETSVMKLHWAPTEQALCDLAMALGGPIALERRRFSARLSAHKCRRGGLSLTRTLRWGASG
jgi:alkylation response protein AidB-like acyl-CoA dehydrogenase